MFKQKYTLFLLFFVFIFACLFTLITLKGNKGKPIYFQHELDTKVGGPFEATNSTSRYALTVAIVENHSFYFTNELARFAAPDLVQYKGHYFSIFTPGISFLGVPLYILGKLFGMPQFFTYLLNPILAILNAYLITRIAQKLGAGVYASVISGFVYLFATNSLAYALTFTQHQASVTVILLALLTIFGERTVLKNILLGILMGAGVLFDIPNLFFLFPIVLYATLLHISQTEDKDSIRIRLNSKILAILFGVIPLMLVFLVYNKSVTGSFTKLGQTVGRSDYITSQQVQTAGKPSLFVRSVTFNTRLQLNGLYILLISNERGILYYFPVVVLGVLGIFGGLGSKRKETKNILLILASVILVDILLYSMFGDPWGGWSFGPRYLIPSTALLCIAVSLSLQRYGKNLLFTIVFLMCFSYSLWVSTLGALTTNAIPPMQEAIKLVTPIPYTYAYNKNFIDEGFTSSLFYNLFLTHALSARSFMYLFDVCIFVIFALLYFFLWTEEQKSE